jgi:hypothetical protein
MGKAYPTIGCCGIDCGLCPRYYTTGNSRCPGCGGEGFEEKHPPCSVRSCCEKKHGLEVCSQCEEYSCARYADREKIERDSFVTHKRIFKNHERIIEIGLKSFLLDQSRRILILEDMLASHDDGRSKSFYCLAAALLPIESLNAAISDAECGDTKGKAKLLRASLIKCAEVEGISLTLQKG